MKDRAVLVTGAARGIGRATAELLAREGAYVVVTDVRDDEGVAVADALGRPVVYQRLDVRREGEWKEALSFIEDRFGRLDVLVNNAGVTGFEEDLGPQDPEHATLEGWRAVHATNLDGVFLGCKHAIQTMRRTRNGGSIVNVSSRSGLVGIPGARRLRLQQGRCAQPHQERRPLLRRAGARDTLQLRPPGRDPHTYVGPDAW
jgi:NAD(P)-dependent dehydrogenase (short-subunit alcohol dehydrogenase family)